MNITSYALKNRALLKFLLAILLTGGIFSFYQMSKMEDPEITVIQAMVIATYPGATPYEVELEVAEPLERAILTMPSVRNVQSKSMDNLCMLTIDLEKTTQPGDLQQEWDLLRRKINDIIPSLPSGASTPVVMDNFGDVFGMFYAITFDGFSPTETMDYVTMIERRLKTIEGVGQISLYGEPVPSIDVEIDQTRIASLGILPSEILSSINNNNTTIYGGALESGNSRYSLDIGGKYQSINDIGKSILKGHQDETFKLSDIASIKPGTVSPLRSSLYYDGIQAVGLSIAMKKGFDITKVGKAVTKEIEQINLPAGIEINKVFYQPDRVNKAIHQFIGNLILSIVIVIAVLMITMGWRTGAVIGLGLLITVLGTVMILGMLNGTLQRVSLGAFIIAMGMLVDNAIVVADGILVDKRRGIKAPDVLTNTTDKTAWPLFGATVIAILAFFPIVLSPDTAGQYVRDLFIVLTVSLLLSWLLALTQIPLNMDRIIRNKKYKQQQQQSNRYEDKFRKAVTFVLTHKTVMLSGVIIMLGLSIWGFRYVPRGFFPNMVYDQLYIEYQRNDTKNNAQIESDLKEIENWLKTQEGIKHVTISMGGTPSRYNLVRTIAEPALNYGELIVDFESPKILEKSTAAIQQYLNDQFPEAYARVKRYNLMYMKYPVELMFTGPDPAVLKSLAEQAKNVMDQTDGAILVTDDLKNSVPSLYVNYNHERAAQSALSRTEVGLSLLAATDGIPVSVFYDGKHRIPIIFKTTGAELENNAVWRIIPNVDALNEETFRDIYLGLKDKGDVIEELTATVPIHQINDQILINWKEPVVRRYNGNRAIKAQCNTTEQVTAEQLRQRLVPEINQIDLPDGYTMTWQGEYEASSEAQKYLFANVPLAIVLMIGILIAFFKDYKKQLIIILCLPLDFFGIVLSCLSGGKDFGFVAIVGT